MIKNNKNLIENIDALIDLESIRSLLLEKQNSIQSKNKKNNILYNINGLLEGVYILLILLVYFL